MYRLLDEGEDILPTDQYFDTRHGWQPCNALRPHTVRVSYSSLPVRRKIEDTKELGTSPNTGSPKLPEYIEFHLFCEKEGLAPSQAENIYHYLLRQLLACQ